MNTKILPEGYEEYKKIDFVNSKKDAVIVNVCALIIAMLLIFLTDVPFKTVIPKGGFFPVMLKIVLLLIALFAYIVLHEAIHGIAIGLFTKSRPHFGIQSTYAYTGSEGYIDKRSYIIIALAPMIILGACLLAILFSVPIEWYWFVYILVILNFAGSAGDLYVTWLTLRLPKEALIHDEGVTMTVFVENLFK
jgi:hypothetical protein